MRPPPSRASASCVMAGCSVSGTSFSFVMFVTPHSTLETVEGFSSPSVVFRYGDRLCDPLGFRADKIDRQEPVLQFGTHNFHAASQHERALELPRGNAAVEILTRLVVLLAAADDELVLLSRHIELFARE